MKYKIEMEFSTDNTPEVEAALDSFLDVVDKHTPDVSIVTLPENLGDFAENIASELS